MSFGRVALAWMGVSIWLLLMNRATLRLARSEFDRTRAGGPLNVTLVEAALVTLLGSLWFASLGSGGWWLVFGLLALVVDVPARLRAQGQAGGTVGAGGTGGSAPTRGAFAADRHGETGPARLARLARLSTGVLLTMTRFLISGLILSLVL